MTNVFSDCPICGKIATATLIYCSDACWQKQRQQLEALAAAERLRQEEEDEATAQREEKWFEVSRLINQQFKQEVPDFWIPCRDAEEAEIAYNIFEQGGVPAESIVFTPIDNESGMIGYFRVEKRASYYDDDPWGFVNNAREQVCE